MLEIITPANLFHTQIAALESTLPSVFDGRADGIHAARIATRRIRELLPLLGGELRSVSADDLKGRFRRMGRSLGRVRDADVVISLLASLEQRIPHAAPTLVLVRQRRERERLTLMRKLIKRLERLDALRTVAALARARRVRFALGEWSVREPKWQSQLRAVVAERASALCEAIEHATGVYFPRRTHSARIAIKRLRYATEIVHETGFAPRSAAIRELKKAQDLLGDLHDRQELSDHLAMEACQAANPDGRDVQVALVRQVIDAEARGLHERYVARRDRLIAACSEAADLPRASAARVPAVALTALALSSGVYALRRSRVRLGA